MLQGLNVLCIKLSNIGLEDRVKELKLAASERIENIILVTNWTLHLEEYILWTLFAASCNIFCPGCSMTPLVTVTLAPFACLNSGGIWMVWRNAGGICERKTLFRMEKKADQTGFKGTRTGPYTGMTCRLPSEIKYVHELLTDKLD